MTSKHFRPGQKLLQWFLLCIVVGCIGGGVALLAQYQQGETKAGAIGASRSLPQYGDISVSGPPTLTAATVDAIFARVGSPMVGTGKVVESMSRQTSIDDAFAMGVWWTETNDGAAGVGSADRNPGSVRGSVGYPSAFDGYTIYPSFSAAIVYWFNMLRNNYVNRGLGTVYTIARPYVGTTSYPLWAGKVINLIWSYRGIAPPPPVVTPTPKPTITPAQQAIARARNHKFTTLQQSLSDGNATPIYSQGLSQESSPFPSPSPSTSDTATISSFVQNAVVLSGLLLAVIVLLVGFKFKDNRSATIAVEQSHQDDHKDHPHMYTNTNSQAALDFAPSTSTEDLPVLPTPTSTPIPIPAPIPVSESPSQQRITEALPRRVLLLPSYDDKRVPIEVGKGQPQGLLKRYG